MKCEFTDEFNEFFKKGVSMLEKTIKMKNHAMELCEKRANKWTAGILKQEIQLFTNKELAGSSMGKLNAHCNQEMSIIRPQDLFK